MEPPKSRSSLPLREWLIWTRLRPQTVFLVIVSTLGLAVLVTNAPFQAPDENDHFYRAFQLSEGTIVAEKREAGVGGSLPVLALQVADTHGIPFHGEVKMTRALFVKKLEPAFVNWNQAPRAFGVFPHTVVYPPQAYLPQALALLLGKLLHVGPLGLLYLARLAGFAVSVTLAYYALSYLPVYRWSAMLLLLGPMSLYLMGSVAPDGVLIASAFLLVSLIVRLAAEDGALLGWKVPATIVALSAILATAKFVYLPVAVVAPILVLPSLRRPRYQGAFSLAWIVFCLIPLWAWGRIVASLYVPGRTDIPIDPVAQWHFVAGAPMDFLLLVATTIREQFFDVYHWFVGVMGWGDTPLPDWFYFAYGFGLLACLVFESAGARVVRKSQRLVPLLAAAISVLLIFGAQYATWNSPGSRDPIEGIEGRYFLPLAPLVIVAIPPLGKFRAMDFFAPMIGILLGTTSAAVCLWTVVARYYVA